MPGHQDPAASSTVATSEPGRTRALLLSYSCVIATVMMSLLTWRRRGMPIPLTTVAPYPGSQRYGKDKSHHTRRMPSVMLPLQPDPYFNALTSGTRIFVPRLTFPCTE